MLKKILLFLILVVITNSCNDEPDSDQDTCHFPSRAIETACIDTFIDKLKSEDDRWTRASDRCISAGWIRFVLYEFDEEFYFICECETCNKVGQVIPCHDLETNKGYDFFINNPEAFKRVGVVAYQG